MRKQLKPILLSIFFSLCIFTYADVKLPSIFSDNMVLQQNTDVNIWGKATPGEEVMIQTSWSSKKIVVVADINGKWRTKFKTPKASVNASIKVEGKNKLSINNVLIGEVWLCTGQSNMEFPVAKKTGWLTSILNEEEEMKDADFPEIRLFHIEHQLAHDAEMDDCVGKWTICTPENLKDFSAVGFVFGRKLHKELKVPVGLIQSTWGGTHAESWTKMDIMKNNPLYADVLVDFRKEIAKGKLLCKVPATLWNGMLAPIRLFTFKGNIWYQGESNAIRHEKYQEVFTNMINSWRAEFEQPNMPFYFVQIAPHYGQPAEIRDAQLSTWKAVKNTGMVVITDAGDTTDIHPRNKRIVGERLAAWALAKDYKKKNAYSGPVYKSMKIEGDKIVLSFDYAKSGLNSKNEALRGFFVSGADNRFYPAVATIIKNQVLVSAPQVKSPVAVRYGWGKYFKVNLYNNDGFPATPFRTDSFAPDTYARRFADSEMRRFPEAWQLDHGKRLYFGYSQGLGCLAMLKMWKKTGDERYFNYVKNWADTIINAKGEIHLYKPETFNIDYINPGKILFDVYKKTQNNKYKLAMDVLIEQLKKHPRTTEGGYWHKLIYPHQIWLDGIYMASPFMAQYGLEFNQPQWIDEAIKQVTICYKNTYDSVTGLNYHAWDESKSQLWANPQTGHSPNFWGRSIGWYYMAVVDVLDFVPVNHPRRHELIKILENLAEVLPKYLRKGLWYQILDQPHREGNFPEASVTTQFMYAYAKAANKGYIDKKYLAFAHEAFNGLQKKLLIENHDGTLTLTRCCAVSGLGGNPYRDGSYEYYIGERMRDNDAKATGPFIMACIELGL